MANAVRIGVVLPDVLGTYSDSGNATVLQRRLEWRGIPAEVTEFGLSDAVPESLDLYLLGGGEDEAQALAASHLRQHPGLQRAAARGAVVFGVCAGLQVLGTAFRTSSGVHSGLGLLDVTTEPGARRAVGEIVVNAGEGLGVEPLTGFENHLGVSTLGPGSMPMGTVAKGIGNGNGTDGAVTGRVAATYLHGPVLARNPALADLLLAWVLGAPLPALPLADVTALRAERLRAAKTGHLR